MITRIEIDGFKSFKNFEMDFTPLTMIAGSNASGSSNLFEALQLLSRLVEVDIQTAFINGYSSFIVPQDGKRVLPATEALERLSAYLKFQGYIKKAFRELNYLH
jgi:AAA15 family ATPase/GTPase